MARRTLNRKELRAANEAAEARDREKKEEEAEDEDDEEDDDEDDEEETEESEESGEADSESEGDDEDDEDKPKKKKKKKAVAKPKAPKAPKRARAGKIIRQRIVWTVFSNSHQPVARFDYPKRAEADAHAAKLTADKKSTHFVQAVKEPIEEKAEDKPEKAEKGK